MDAINQHDQKLATLRIIRDQLKQIIDLSDLSEELLISARLAHALDCVESRVESVMTAYSTSRHDSIHPLSTI
ncbi:hypothetical protein [Sphingomonas radiodurans]|uniref:hypothetical protein n=1 Tax=Sphingomonas radiodurans TaxID=2890321 RepID=UPI001E5F6209|nr:hypothetical protein [Sphingomonas radiodurans]WBH15343.1 hypothetical protein LLW23_10855 [Sphingomonas radiodurans]